jgi:hypothetical protein
MSYWHGGHAGFDERLELAGVQISPLTFSPAVDVSPLGGVCGVSPELALLQNDFHHNSLVCQRQLYLLHRPWGMQSKKVFVQRYVFHGTVNQFEKLNSAGVNVNSQWNR